MGALRQLFGPSKKEIWQQLAEQIGGTYDPGGFFGQDRVQATAGEWTITLDTYTVSTGKSAHKFTRLRAPYINPDGFRFSIRRAGLADGLGAMLGLQDIEIGDVDFDRDFIIKGNDENKVRALFASARLRELCREQKQLNLDVRDDEGWFGATFPNGVDELRFHVHGVIKDVERLRSLFELFAQLLDELCRIGSAYEGAPGVAL